MKSSLIALALAAALPLSAQAADLNYNFVELDYARTNIDNTDANPDGFGIKGSAKIAEPLYVFGSYLRGSDSVSGVGIDFDQFQIGLGYRNAVRDNTDFIGELSYIKDKVDVSGFGSGDAHGYRASAGFRSSLADNFEGYVKANWTDGGDFDGKFSGTLGAQYKFNPTWGLTGEAEFGGQADVYSIGVRASF